MKLDPQCIVFTGGGSGGHIFPGLAVIEELRRSWAGRIVWIGSSKDMERAAVEKAGLEFLAIPSGKLRRQFSLRNFLDLFRIAAGYVAALGILRRLRPCLLFSKGGYVSVPPCAAAAALGIPYFTHESDVSPGLATRLNAGRAAAILVSWQATLNYLKPAWQRKTIICGNPVRSSLAAGDAARGRAFLGCPAGLPVILVLGGSQGALQVNGLIGDILPRLAGRAFVAHQTGAGFAPCRPADSGYRGFEFVHAEMADLMAAASLVVGRAGAGTIWESSACGLPLLLIPLSGSGTRGDQVHNAKLLAAAGAARCLLGDEANPDRLLAGILQLLETPAERAALVAALRRQANPAAAPTSPH